MIQITKNSEPQVLIDNKQVWTDNLDNLVSKYKSYAKIPDSQKKKALAPYSHPDIIKALKAPTGSAKCVFCESFVNVSSYLQVEHYHPKSLYWKEAFVWDNLFVSCGYCNCHKLSFDTKNKPFIHPSNEDPEDYLTYFGITIKPRSNDPTSIEYQKAWNVIDNCKLKRVELSRNLSNVAMGFANIEESLSEKNMKYMGYNQPKRKLCVAEEILPVLNDLNLQASDFAQYSGYMRYLLRESAVIQMPVKIVNNHFLQLGLSTPFSWCFKY